MIYYELLQYVEINSYPDDIAGLGHSDLHF